MQRYLLLITLFIVVSCNTPIPSNTLVQSKDTPVSLITPMSSPSSTTSPLPTATLTLKQKCKSPFQDSNDVRNFYSQKNISDKTWGSIISAQIIEDSERYLNNCTNFKAPLVSQPEELKVFNQPISGSATDSSITEFLDWNDDNVDELIFHTTLGFPISFVFTKVNPQDWYGTMIWPPISNCCDFNYPVVHLLELDSSLNYRLIAVEGEFWGADHGSNILTIWRLKDKNPEPELMLKVSLSNWCGQPSEWKITEKGEIIIPAAEKTERCSARKEMVIGLENDKFVIKNLTTLDDSYNISCDFFADWNWRAELDVCNVIH